MKHYLLGTALVGLVALPAALAAQPASLAGVPLTGTPNGVPVLQSHNSKGFPTPKTVEGQPIETRAPEKTDDHPVFPGQTRAPYRKSVDYKVETLVGGLNNPWALAFLPDGKILISEKAGTMRILYGNTLSQPLSGVPTVYFRGQVGLLDVALDNGFKSNHRIFFTYSEKAGASDSNIVLARATLDEKAGALSDVKVIYRVLPPLDGIKQNSNEGGRIAIAKDGTIFMTVGDRSKSPPWLVAQRLDTALGKIIHVTADGNAAPGNPFIGKSGARPEIWSLGHRSEEGLSFDPRGRLWEVEHGPRGGDELNLIEKGKNYGWPVISHAIDYPGIPLGQGITQKAGMEQPRYYWDPVIAPSGLAFYKGSLFPAWKNSVFVGGMRGMMLDRLELSGTKVTAEEPLLVDLKQRIRDVRIGPDGAVYVLTDGGQGKLIKLVPR